MPIYIQYNLFPYNTTNNGIGCGFVFQYSTGGTHQQIINSDKKHEEIKDEFKTMVEVDNQLNKQIYHTVYKK